MCALNYDFYLCLILASTIPGYGTVASDGAAAADVRHVLVQAGESVDIVCNMDDLLARCGLTQPNASDLLFVNQMDRTSCRHHTGESDSSGAGLWTCVFWRSAAAAAASSPRRAASAVPVPVSVPVPVPLTVALAARPLAPAPDTEGGSVSLSCVRSGAMIPISECYFTPHKQHNIQTNHMTMTTKEHVVAGAGREQEVAVAGAARDAAGAGAGSGGDADEKPVAISVQSYVCANLAFLATFVALVYCKERYWTRYYGATWPEPDDDDDASNRARARARQQCPAHTHPLVAVV